MQQAYMKTLVTLPGPDSQRFYLCHAGRSARSNKVRGASRPAAPQCAQLQGI
jgi:hypothetical protein